MPQPLANRLAAIVLPVPGGPQRRTLRRGAPLEDDRATLCARSSTCELEELRRSRSRQGGGVL